MPAGGRQRGSPPVREGARHVGIERDERGHEGPRLADCTDLGHERARRLHRRLDMRGRHIVPARIDHDLFLAARHPQEAVGIDPAKIAGPIPAVVGQNLGVLGGCGQIAWHDRRAADQDFTIGRDRDFGVRRRLPGASDPHAAGIDHGAIGAGLACAIHVVDGQTDRREKFEDVVRRRRRTRRQHTNLRQAERLAERREMPCVRVGDRVGDFLGNRRALLARIFGYLGYLHQVARRFFADRIGEQRFGAKFEALPHPWETSEPVRLDLREQRRKLRRIVAEGHVEPEQQRGHIAAGAFGDMRVRQPGNDPVAIAQADVRADAARGGQEIPMRELDALGLAGGSGGVDDREQIVGIGRVGGGVERDRRIRVRDQGVERRDEARHGSARAHFRRAVDDDDDRNRIFGTKSGEQRRKLGPFNEQHRNSGVADDVAKLFGCRCRVERYRQAAGEQHTQVGDKIFGDVAHQQARCKPSSGEGSERGCDAACIGRERGARPAIAVPAAAKEYALGIARDGAAKRCEQIDWRRCTFVACQHIRLPLIYSPIGEILQGRDRCQDFNCASPSDPDQPTRAGGRARR